MDKSATARPALPAHFADHDRHWRDFDYVYPVLSRRSGGLSIGINLQPGQGCNYDCIYCQVNRSAKPKRRDVDEAQLLQELNSLLDLAANGDIYQTPEFADVPIGWRRVNDVAFSGDGEPTSYPGFAALVARVAELVKKHEVTASHARSAPTDKIKIVLITNASLLHRPDVTAALRIMDENHGEVWAKLDAGTEAYYRLVNRAAIPFNRVLENILACAKERSTVIQSLFMKIHGRGPDAAEIEAYGQRLGNIVRQGGQIKLVQVYTLARPARENYVTMLENAELDTIAGYIRQILPAVPVEVYYGIQK